jgi:hypothetical protein
MSERDTLISTKGKEYAQLPPFSCNLVTGTDSINLYTDLPNLKADLANPQSGYAEVIPGWSVRHEPGDGKYSVYVIQDENPVLHYDDERDTLYVHGTPEMFADGQPIAWLSYWLTEAQRQSHSSFTMHSSAMRGGDKGILLLGHSGSGKTSLMLDYCRRYDGEVISNDLTIVNHDPQLDSMALVDGTKEIRLRQTSVLRNFPDLNTLFTNEGISPWENKITVSPEDIGIRSAQGHQNLDAIFEIHLDSSNDSDLIVHRVRGIGIKYRLYEDMSRIVRASAISVFTETEDFIGYMPSLDGEKLHNNRVECINCMTDNIGVISLSGGNLRQVTSAMKEIIESI